MRRAPDSTWRPAFLWPGIPPQLLIPKGDEKRSGGTCGWLYAAAIPKSPSQIERVRHPAKILSIGKNPTISSNHMSTLEI